MFPPHPAAQNQRNLYATELEDGEGWVCWSGEVYRHLSTRKLRGRTAALLLWPPAAAASPKCKLPAPLARTNMDVQALLSTFHNSLPAARTSIHPREAHGLSEANMTSRLDFNDGKGPSQDMCSDEFHCRTRQTHCRGQHRWEHQSWGWAQRQIEDTLCMQRHNSAKQEWSHHLNIFKLGEMLRKSQKI